MLDVRTHTDGGQTAEAVAERLAAWLGAAQRTLDLALYDVRLPDAPGDRVAGAIREAAARGVDVRIAFNQDERPPDDEIRRQWDNVIAEARSRWDVAREQLAEMLEAARPRDGSG